ncbi:MAG: NAD-dependent epimerase/dehydratase family protein, partial [Proteobacteria bacterium]|nr:NAD-dependent epimerase/dehydratase family protein [Pseudomonadota bacterium]
PLREFMHVDDLADACVFLMERDVEAQVINAGSSSEISIRDLANLIGRIVDYEGEIVFNTEMPDGTPRKLMDSGRMRALGWEPGICLEDGIAATYRWALAHRFAG